MRNVLAFAALGLLALIGRAADTPAGLSPTIIDGGGRLLTPGFIDAHVYMSMVLTAQDLKSNDPVYVAALEIRGAERALLRALRLSATPAGQ